MPRSRAKPYFDLIERLSSQSILSFGLLEGGREMLSKEFFQGFKKKRGDQGEERDGQEEEVAKDKTSGVLGKPPEALERLMSDCDSLVR